MMRAWRPLVRGSPGCSLARQEAVSAMQWMRCTSAAPDLAVPALRRLCLV